MTAPHRPRRLPLLILLSGAILALSVLAWPWVRQVAVAPVALMGWLLLRVFVLSVHQALYWMALVFAFPVLLWVMLRRRPFPAAEPGPIARARRSHPLETWRWVIDQTASGMRPLPSIGWNEFVQMVVSLRALDRHVAPDYLLHDALRDGRVPLPPDVHAFLFPPPPVSPRRRLARLRRWLGTSVTGALRRLSGRERAERLRSMSRLLSFLEESLEIPRHDHTPDSAHP
jgi:hypothetical protein